MQQFPMGNLNFLHGIFYIGVERPAGDIAGWMYSDGTPVYQSRAWYIDNSISPVPTNNQLQRKFAYHV